MISGTEGGGGSGNGGAASQTGSGARVVPSAPVRRAYQPHSPTVAVAVAPFVPAASDVAQAPVRNRSLSLRLDFFLPPGQGSKPDSSVFGVGSSAGETSSAESCLARQAEKLTARLTTKTVHLLKMTTLAMTAPPLQLRWTNKSIVRRHHTIVNPSSFANSDVGAPSGER